MCIQDTFSSGIASNFPLLKQKNTYQEIQKYNYGQIEYSNEHVLGRRPVEGQENVSLINFPKPDKELKLTLQEIDENVNTLHKPKEPYYFFDHNNGILSYSLWGNQYVMINNSIPDLKVVSKHRILSCINKDGYNTKITAYTVGFENAEIDFVSFEFDKGVEKPRMSLRLWDRGQCRDTEYPQGHDDYRWNGFYSDGKRTIAGNEPHLHEEKSGDFEKGQFYKGLQHFDDFILYALDVGDRPEIQAVRKKYSYHDFLYKMKFDRDVLEGKIDSLL